MPKAKSNKQRLSLVPRREESHPPPDRLPIYRLLTGKDDESFCQRVSEALSAGYRLHGSPAICFNGQHVIAAQAIVWPFEDHADIDDAIPF